MTRLARFLSLYVDQAARTAEVHVQRIGKNGHAQTGRYTLHEGEPSIDRLWALIRDHKHTDYPAQQGWGVTSTNGRAHSVYTFAAR